MTTKRRVSFDFGSKAVRVPHDQKAWPQVSGMVAEAGSWEYEMKKREDLSSQSTLTVKYFSRLSAFLIASEILPPIKEQVFKCLIVWRQIFKQTSTEFKRAAMCLHVPVLF